MATLEKIRTKGPLLVVVIGLALFAFIAGDAWKILQPHQKQDAGEVEGEVLTTREFQSMVEEYTEVIKLSSGMKSLNDQQNDQIKDEVWRTFVNNKLIEKQAEELGLVVTDQEIKSIIEEGTDPMLMQTPFVDRQTGRFDKNALVKFLDDYSKLSSTNSANLEQYTSLYKYWSFVERNLRTNRLAQKYQALVAKSLFSNPVEAKAMFDARVNQSDLVLAALPYSSVADSAVSVTNSEIENLYNKKKEQFKQFAETRDIKYINVQVKASDADKAALQEELDEAIESLDKKDASYPEVIRNSASKVPYVDMYFAKESLPKDVVARLDSVATGNVFGSYYNVADNSLNAFKLIDKKSEADSIQFRQIQVYDQDADRTKFLADSIYKAIKGGADFEAIAQKFNQNAQSVWVSSSVFNPSNLNAQNVKFINTIYSLGKKEVANLSMGQANVILQVLKKKHTVKKYKVAVVKRTVEFSNETYNKAYNDFSQFAAANTTLEQIEANAEEAGYKLLERANLSSSEHMVGGVRNTKEALRWIFKAEKGDVSNLYECGESDQMIVVAVTGVNEKGYMSVNKVKEQLRAELLRDKKAEILMSKLGDVKSIAQVEKMENAVVDSVKHVSFSAPAYISALRSSEPMVSAYVATAAKGQVSAPIKGNAGVYVMKVYSTDKLAEKFDAEKEQLNQKTMNVRLASRFLNDLYMKSDITDNRYLFF